jgi:hypothetical protein
MRILGGFLTWMDASRPECEEIPLGISNNF